MAILTSRCLQDLLYDAAAFLNDEQGNSLVRRLNGPSPTALEAEWELLVLSALDRGGALVHEPTFGGASRLDFSFEHSETGMVFIGDITAISDDTIERTTLGVLRDLLIKKLDKEGIRGQISIELDYEQLHGSIRPKIPPPQDFRRYVFGKEFHTFARAIRANPTKEHRTVIRNAKAGISISYTPGHERYTVHSPEIRMPRNLTKNIVYSTLEDKRDQIKKSGHQQGSGYRCIILCDGACAALTKHNSWDTKSKNEIILHFLRKTNSLDIVACVSIQNTTSSPLIDGGFEFVVEVFEKSNLGSSECFQAILEGALNNRPRPVRTAVNAKQYVERRKGPFFIYSGTRGSTFGASHFEVSSRAVFDYVANRIDREKFERVLNPQVLESFRQQLDAGKMVIELKLERNSTADDDTVVIRLGNPDAAVSPFRFSRYSTK